MKTTTTPPILTAYDWAIEPLPSTFAALMRPTIGRVSVYDSIGMLLSSNRLVRSPTNQVLWARPTRAVQTGIAAYAVVTLASLDVLQGRVGLEGDGMPCTFDRLEFTKGKTIMFSRVTIRYAR